MSELRIGDAWHPSEKIEGGYLDGVWVDASKGVEAYLDGAWRVLKSPYVPGGPWLFASVYAQYGAWPELVHYDVLVEWGDFEGYPVVLYRDGVEILTAHSGETSFVDIWLVEGTYVYRAEVAGDLAQSVEFVFQTPGT